MNINELPPDLLQTVISWITLYPRISWDKKLSSWQSTMLVSITWMNAFKECIKYHHPETFDLLHNHFRFSQNDSWKSKWHAKLMVRAEKFLTQYGHCIYKIDSNETSYRTCKVIAKCCPNLRSLKFYSLCQTEERMKEIIFHFKTFTELTELNINAPRRKAKIGNQTYTNTLPKSSFIPSLLHFTQLKKLTLNVDLKSEDHLSGLTKLTQLEDLTFQFKDSITLESPLTSLVTGISKLSKLTIVIFGELKSCFSDSFFQTVNNSKINELIISKNLFGGNIGLLSRFDEKKHSIHKLGTISTVGGGFYFEFTGSSTTYFIRKELELQIQKRSPSRVIKST